MGYLERFLSNHVLANLIFGLVIVFGVIAFLSMPRSRDPDINFNWVVIHTALPGAASIEVEKRITDPLEDIISRKIKDTRFVSSTSRDGISVILIRFNDLSEREFDKHIADLRREVQSVYTDQLPAEATDPEVLELTTSSGFPTAVLALTSNTIDEDFRRYVSLIQKELERVKGVDSAALAGYEKPELHIAFYPNRLEGLGITPADLADTVSSYFSDVSMGDLEADDRKWIVRLEGTSGSLEDIARFPVVGAGGVVELGSLADIYRTSAEPRSLVSYQDRPAVMIEVTKQEGANTIAVLDNLKTLLQQENVRIEASGYEMHLIDDQTVSTREAIVLMQNNALIGLFFVVLVTYLFLGGHIALLTSIGIPFTLAGTFIALDLMGFGVSNPVLLGVVIALGMLVDDAVVVVEAIHFRLQRGVSAMQAALTALNEVFAPVLTSVLTTMAVFLPLMLLPGVLGEFMRVIPLVVCLGLAISLIEAFWMLPAHVAFLRVNLSGESKTQQLRVALTHQLRRSYSRLLIKTLRYPLISSLMISMAPVLAVLLILMGGIKVNFFASDPYRLFYVNAELPSGTSLSRTLEILQGLESQLQTVIEPEELMATISYSGRMFLQTEQLVADNVGQIMVSLAPKQKGMRSVYAVVNAVEQSLGTRFQEADISVLLIEDGPPVQAPVALKVRGGEFGKIQNVVDEFAAFMREQDIYNNIRLDFKPGNPELTLALNGDAIKRAGIHPSTVTRSLQSYVDGELINQYQYRGEEVDVRLVAKTDTVNIETLLQQTIAAPDGGSIAFGDLLDIEYGLGYQNIRHYDFQRAVTVSADINEDKTDAVAANALLYEFWRSIRINYPGVSIDTAGQLDDIEESLSGMAKLFVMGLGIIYLILGTQFKSYFQPVLVLSSIPLAFSGVVFGLVLTGNPMSLNTLYGVVALAGISVNAAIVMVSAANSRVEQGMSVLHATIFAARRRVVPVLITSLTTVAGLFSLAAGFAGKSLVWGPVATAIVGGLMFSTCLVLLAIPLLYRFTAKFKYANSVGT